VVMRYEPFVRFVIAFCLCFATNALLYVQAGSATQTSVRRQKLSASRLDELIAQNRYPELQRDLATAELSTVVRTYFEGIVADRTHKVAEAIALLSKALPDLKVHSPYRAALALRALASDYFEAGRYGDSADAFAVLLKNYRGQFHAGDLQEFSDNLHTYELLRGAPAQAVAGSTGFTVAARRDPLGNTDVPITIGKTEMWWMFDTGANISTISMSTAKRLELTLSRGSATTQSGATGNEVPLRTAIIPELRFGGAVIRNVVVLVMEDKELDINLGTKGHYVIEGIFGYPLISALGSFTIFDDQMDIAAPSSSSTRCAPLYVQDLTPLIVIRSQGKDLAFSFDSGASTGSLTARYFHAFPAQFASLKPNRTSAGGAGGTRFMQGYTLPSLELRLGTATATLHDLVVVTQLLGVSPLDSMYGNLGQTLVAPFRSYTIDFRRMQLCAGELRKPAQ
jgi:predicted aspartyl protease